MSTMPWLFDANGEIGYGSTRFPDFPTCRDRLAHMDRLGIARSLVWSCQGRDQNPPTGNRRLLAELDTLTPFERRRLVPSLVISPSMLYEKGGVDDLVSMMQNGVHALWTFPTKLRHRLQHLEPILERVQSLRPTLMVDVSKTTDDRDLLALAERFPNMRIVCMFGMWPHLFCMSLIHVLRHTDNVLIDSSWLHSGGTLEMIVRKFGSDRIVFATGWKSHNGASIAHLLAAEVDEDVREDIAHRNLERLLQLEPTESVVPAIEIDSDRGDVWASWLAGRPLGVELMDAHAHLGPLSAWFKEDGRPESEVAALLQHMDRLGIRTAFVSSSEALFSNPVEGNRSLEETLSPHGDRFRGYYSYNPVYAELLDGQLEECFARPFWAGLKLLCDYWQVPVTHPDLEPAYAFANAHRLPILLHTWEGACDSPAMLTDIARRYPEARFLLGHSGGTDQGRREAIKLAKDHPNVYLEWCGGFCSSILWEDAIAQVGSDRVVFGTDALGHSIDWELGRLLSLDLPTKAILPILGDNMRGIIMSRT